jgi:hypothetical protein
VDEHHQLVRWTKRLAIFTGLLFGITVIIAFLSFKQLGDSNRALVTSQRAFVYPDPAGHITGVTQDAKFIWRNAIKLQNSGNTSP